MSQIPDDEALVRALREGFGHERFRPGQLEVIRSVLSGRPTVTVMPTGAGKSLCFQLPALLAQGLTLVVSPLVALMKDQVDALSALRIPATFINSTLSEAQRAERIAALRAGSYRLLYVAPERFRSASFMAALRALPVALFAVDEAHCISAWGHDFRPDYSRLGEVRKELAPPFTLALTATATARVRQDIAALLGLENPAVHLAGFDRPNLFFEVVPARGERHKADLAAAVAREGGSGIVYAATRRSAERLAADLGARGVSATCYHAGLPDAERGAVQEHFMAQGDAVVVATNAFGMGVDKAGIRFVVHADIPRSVEAYYQEIGRAGRDGLRAQAVLLFNHADVFLQERLIRAAHPAPGLIADLWRLVSRFSSCDLGLGAMAGRLGCSEAEISAALKHLEHAGHLQRMARGEGLARIGLKRDPAGLPPAARATNPRRALDAVATFLRQGEEREIPFEDLADRATLSVPALRRALIVLAGDDFVSYVPPAAERALRIADVGLRPADLRIDFAALRQREAHERMLLRQMSCYAYARGCRRRYLLCYFGERAEGSCTCCDACSGPVHRVQLETPGASPPGRPRWTPSVVRPAERADTRELSYELLARGLSLAEAARQRQLSERTLARHAADLLDAGRPLDVDRLMAKERREAILSAASRTAPKLASIKAVLPPSFSFEEIRLALAARSFERAEARRQEQATSPHAGAAAARTQPREAQRSLKAPPRLKPLRPRPAIAGPAEATLLLPLRPAPPPPSEPDPNAPTRILPMRLSPAANDPEVQAPTVIRPPPSGIRPPSGEEEGTIRPTPASSRR